MNVYKDDFLCKNTRAEQAQLSPYYLQRSFKAMIGVTPKEYLDSYQLGSLKKWIKSCDSVTSTLYETGYSLPGRVYEKSTEKLGMTPHQYRHLGKLLEIS